MPVENKSFCGIMGLNKKTKGIIRNEKKRCLFYRAAVNNAGACPGRAAAENMNVSVRIVGLGEDIYNGEVSLADGSSVGDALGCR